MAECGELGLTSALLGCLSLFWQVSVLSAQGSDMSDALVPVMTGHDGRFDESQAAELIAAQVRSSPWGAHVHASASMY